MTKNPWKTISSRTVYSNPWITVREDSVLNPNGNPGIYGVVQSRIATGVVALTELNEVYLIGQYRYPTEMYSWEIPEGGAEVGEDPLSAIQRELREEAGVIASEWMPLGSEMHLSNCHSSERAFLYIARNLTVVAQEPDDTEVLAVKKVPFKEVLQMVDEGTIVDAMTIIAILRAQRMLGL